MNTRALLATVAIGILLLGLAFAQTLQDKKPFALRSAVVFQKLEEGADNLTRTGTHWVFRRAVPVSKDTFLCLLDYRKSQLDRWGDEKLIEKEKRENHVVDSVPIKSLESGLLLALVHRSGKVIKRSTIGPQVPQFPGGLTWSQPLPVAMERSADCPYGIVHPGRRVLACYDLQLNWTRSFEIPLDEIGFTKPVNRGETVALWVFGQRFPSGALAPDHDATYPVTSVGPEALGGILELPSGRWIPLPFSASEMLAQLQLKARGPDGALIKLRQELLAVRPFDDPEGVEPFWALATAVASKDLDDLAFQGLRAFFRLEIDATGLVTTEQVPLWVVQENRSDLVLEEKHSVVRAPIRTILTDFQGFSLSPTKYAVYLRFAFQVPDDRGNLPRWWEEADVLALVISRTLHRLVAVDDPTSQRWEALRVRPYELRGRLGKLEFAFGAVCRDRQDLQKRFPCFAIMNLEE